MIVVSEGVNNVYLEILFCLFMLLMDELFWKMLLMVLLIDEVIKVIDDKEIENEVLEEEVDMVLD